MKELSPDELEAVLKAPQPKTRKPKHIDRTHRAWFYDISTALGVCDNPDCTDPRNKPRIMVYLHPSGLNMCRFCWLEGWLNEDVAA
jgi:hypothetical protein